jgi:hypothetical protein
MLDEQKKKENGSVNFDSVDAAVNTLDGDRLAAPVIALLGLRREARLKAASVLDEIRGVSKDLEKEIENLDLALADAGREIVSMADGQREAGREETRENEQDSSDLFREARIKIGAAREVLDIARNAAASVPGPVVPKRLMNPGFLSHRYEQRPDNRKQILSSVETNPSVAGVHNARAAAEQIVAKAREAARRNTNRERG